jgi:hypothetical protein
MKRALVLSLAVLFGLGVAAFGQTLSGEWDTTVSIVPTPVSLGLDSTLTVTYAISGWTFTSYSVLDETGWTDQTFDVGGALGAFTLGSFLDLNPAGSFDEWEVTAGVSIAGVTFGLDWDLTDDLAVTLSGSGSAGLVTVGADIYFGDPAVDGCDLNWTGIDITVDFPFCCADVASTISFNCDGFDSVCFDVGNIVLPNFAWMTLGAELCFELQTKTLTLTPSFDFGDIACFDVYMSVDAQAGVGPDTLLNIGDISVAGIGVECTIGGVDFTGVSYWGTGDKPSILYGTDYWEGYQITTTDDGCCGPFSFDISVFFDDDHTSLFDVAEFDANMEIQLATQFSFSMGINIEVDSGFTLWSLGFTVTW